MLSRTEKEQRVIELYQQGKTIREIAHEVHMSFAGIGSIIRKVTGLRGDDDGKPKEQQDKAPTTLSKDSQALALFSQGKKPIEVAIKLDLGADVVDKLYHKNTRKIGREGRHSNHSAILILLFSLILQNIIQLDVFYL
jgi:transposase